VITSKALTTAQMLKLRSATQRVKVDIAFYPPYYPWISKGTTDTGWHEVMDWSPVCVLGPNRIVDVGDSVIVSCLHSYIRGGTELGALDPASTSVEWWVTSYPDGSECGTMETPQSGTSSTAGILDWVYDVSGLYLFTCRVGYNSGGWKYAIGKRWVYYRATSDDPYDGIVSRIESLSGSDANGGWDLSLTLLRIPETIAMEDYMGVMLRVTDSWGEVEQYISLDSGTYWAETMAEDTVEGGDVEVGDDVGTLFNGYVVAGSIVREPRSMAVTLKCHTPDYVLQDSETHARDYWNSDLQSMDPEEDEDGEEVPAPDGWYIDDLTAIDVARHLLANSDRGNVETDSPAEMSNFAEWHDVVIRDFAPTGIYENVVKSLTINESAIWQGLQDLASNEWWKVYSTRKNALVIEPDKLMRPVQWWTGWASCPFEPVMEIDDHMSQGVSVDMEPGGKVNLVQINATSSDEEAIQVEYGTIGSRGKWQVVNGIVADDERYLNQMARAMYLAMNSTVAAQVKMGVNHAVDLGDIVTMRHTTDPHGWLVDRSTNLWVLGVSELDTEAILGEW
jgi:hypothetical protein